MRLARTLARRSLLSRPGRTLFSALGIALGVATVVGVIVLDHNTIVGLSGPARERRTPDVQFRLPTDRGDTSRLYQVEGVSLAARYFQQHAVARLEPTGGGEEGRPDDPDKRRKVLLYALEARYGPELGVYSLAAGEHLDPDGGRQVLIGHGLARHFALEVGDTVWLSRPRRPSRMVCVDGELVPRREEADRPVQWDYRVVGVLAREQLGRSAGGVVALVDFEDGLEIYADVDVQTMVWANRDETVDPERLKRSLASTPGWEIEPAAVLGQAADERAFRNGVTMAGLLALVLGLYVIFHTLSMSLTERVREVGTLHALGATRAQIGRVFLLEAVALAGLGAALGLAAGLGLARLLLSLGITTLGTGKHVGLFVVPWQTVLRLVGLGFAVALVGSIYPLFSLGATSTAAILRGDERHARGRVSLRFRLAFALLLAVVVPGLYLLAVPAIGSDGLARVTAVVLLSAVILLSLVVPALLTGICALVTRPFTAWWPLAGRVTARAMAAAPARIGVCTSALALVVAGFVGLKGVTRSLEGEMRQWAEEAALDKVWLRGLPPTPFDELAAHLHEYPGVVGVEPGGTGEHRPYLIQGLPVEQLAGYGPCAEDPSLLRALEEERGMIVSRRLAADVGYEVGDRVRLSKEGGGVAEHRVVAVSDAYGHFPDPDERMYAVIADHHVEEYWCHPTDMVTEVAVRVEPGTDPLVVEDAVHHFHGGRRGIRVRTGAGVLRSHRADLRRDFFLFDVILLLTAALAGLGILNGQLLAALERSKELGVLQALGTSRGQLAGTVLLEALVVGLVGGLLGALLGLGLVPLAVEELRGRVGLDLPHVGPGPWLWVGLGGGVVVALLSALYPVWRTTRVDAVRAVRTG